MLSIRQLKNMILAGLAARLRHWSAALARRLDDGHKSSSAQEEEVLEPWNQNLGDTTTEEQDLLLSGGGPPKEWLDKVRAAAPHLLRSAHRRAVLRARAGPEVRLSEAMTATPPVNRQRPPSETAAIPARPPAPKGVKTEAPRRRLWHSLATEQQMPGPRSFSLKDVHAGPLPAPVQPKPDTADTKGPIAVPGPFKVEQPGSGGEDKSAREFNNFGAKPEPALAEVPVHTDAHLPAAPVTVKYRASDPVESGPPSRSGRVTAGSHAGTPPLKSSVIGRAEVEPESENDTGTSYRRSIPEEGGTARPVTDHRSPAQQGEAIRSVTTFRTFEAQPRDVAVRIPREASRPDACIRNASSVDQRRASFSPASENVWPDLLEDPGLELREEWYDELRELHRLERLQREQRGDAWSE